MDPIEILQLCKQGSLEGAPGDLTVPGFFSAGDYELLWKREQKTVRRLLDDIVCGEHASDGLDLLLKAGVLSALLPELVTIKSMGTANGSHKDVWEHSKLVMLGVPATPEMRWSALFHDIGKATTRRFDSKGHVTFHCHELVGAKMVDRIQSRLRFFGDDTSMFRNVRLLVQYHLRPASFKESSTDHAVRRFIVDCDESGDRGFMNKLITLSRADITTKSGAKRAKAKARADMLEEKIKEVIAERDAPKLPKGTMGSILDLSGRKPGGWLNELRDGLEAGMRDGSVATGLTMDEYVAIGLERIKQ